MADRILTHLPRRGQSAAPAVVGQSPNLPNNRIHLVEVQRVRVVLMAVR
jgi:hypothetical protein